jgi:hypothetical protein
MRHVRVRSHSRRSVVCEITAERSDINTRLSGLLARTVLKTLRDNGELNGNSALDYVDDGGD